jgi:hypothetical protein
MKPVDQYSMIYYSEGENPPTFRLISFLELEVIVAKRLEDPYSQNTKWFKIPKPNHSQKIDRAELFERRYG